MEVFDKIIELFNSAEVPYKVYEHEPVFTSLDAAKVRGTELSAGAKALVFMADGKPILLVVPGDKKADTGKFKKLFGIKDLAMAQKEVVKEITGVEIGAVPPIGSVMGIQSYFDESFKTKDKVVFNAGLHHKSIEMAALGLIKAENPIFGDFLLQ